MQFPEYWSKLDQGEKELFADNVEASVLYLGNIAAGYNVGGRPSAPSPALAKRIQAETMRLQGINNMYRGVVTKHDQLPKIFDKGE